MRDVPLGTLVFRAGLLPEERLEEALQEGMKTGKRLGEILLEREWVSENDLGRLLAGQKGLPFVDLDPAAVDPTAPPLLPQEKARLHGALPIGFEGGVPVVAVADPSNDLVVENVRRALACEPVLVVAGRDALHRAINQVYGTGAPEVAPAEPAAVVEPQAPPVVAEPVAAVVAAPAPVVEEPAPLQPQPVPVVEPQPLPVSEPQPAPAAVAPAVQPIAVQPVGDGVWLQAAEPAPEPQPVAQPDPQPLQIQPAPVAQPETVAVQPVAAPAVAPPPVPAPEPAPTPDPEPTPTCGVVLRLTNDERLELGVFVTEAEAVEHARAIVAQASAGDGWPFVAGRFIRPDAIVSIDLVELEVAKWLGSQARSAALGPQPSL
jgi:hypothetical protein